MKIALLVLRCRIQN